MNSISDENTMTTEDPWPSMPDGTGFDGKNLLRLLRDGRSPFADRWDVNILINELQDKLASQVVDIPMITKGSNNYGFHFKLSNRPDVVARVCRGDVNMPDYDGFTMDLLVPETKFEVAVYKLLIPESAIRVSRLLYHRIPIEYPLPHSDMPSDIAGRPLLVFERADGITIDWRAANDSQKIHVLYQAATIRAALFNFNPPIQFVNTWFLERVFEQKPKSLPIPIAPTMEFCFMLFESKIQATIKNIGDMIGWPDDENTVSPVAAAAKQSLLRLLPHIIPPEIADKPTLYRLVLDHGDFGIHNMSITADQYFVTSVFDWETWCIVPAILSDPLMAVIVDLVTDENGAPSIIRVPEDTTQDERMRYMEWATQYINPLYEKAPDYQVVIQAGKDARHLWFALRHWKGDDPEDYFGALGEWAEHRIKDLGIKEKSVVQ